VPSRQPEGRTDVASAGLRERRPITLRSQRGNWREIRFGYLAASKGYYSKAGLSVKILPGEGVDVEGIVGAGKALVGDSNADTCSAAVAQGADLKVIGAKYQKNPFCIISSAKKPIKTPQELISKKVGVNAYNFTAQRRSPKASAGPDADADGSGRDGRGACVVTAAGRG